MLNSSLWPQEMAGLDPSIEVDQPEPGGEIAMKENSKQSAVAQFYYGSYRNSGLVDLKEDEYGQYLHMKDPVVLAALAAFCSGNHRRLLLRGCCCNFPKSFPSLFRDRLGVCDNPEERWSAYRYVLTRLKELLTGTRWDRDNLGAVLQHYGIKTPWLDVVRSLHAAIWFATYTVEVDRRSRVAVKLSSRRRRYGWISMYGNYRAGLQQLTVVDLWDAHSSQHVRPHAQQGLSVAMQSDPTDYEDHHLPTACTSDFNTHRVARVRFPVQSKRWRLCGHLFSSRFLFPSRKQDDSLNQLHQPAVRNVLKEACIKHGLKPGTLGAVSAVRTG